MSEYQYYEFLAIDRPLTKEQMAELRQLSTRATITSTRFQNVYNWGDFRSNPEVLMEKHIDAFLYVANWRTNQLDFGPWEQIFYGEFDGRRRKRVLVKILGE